MTKNRPRTNTKLRVIITQNFVSSDRLDCPSTLESKKTVFYDIYLSR